MTIQMGGIMLKSEEEALYTSKVGVTINHMDTKMVRKLSPNHKLHEALYTSKKNFFEIRITPPARLIMSNLNDSKHKI